MGHKLKKGVTIRRDYHATPLLVNSYGSELNQVWTNLIDNAVDAMHGKGELRIKTFPEGDCAVVEIGDSGSGIPPDIQSRIFEPFFTTKGVGRGHRVGAGYDAADRAQASRIDQRNLRSGRYPVSGSLAERRARRARLTRTSFGDSEGNRLATSSVTESLTLRPRHVLIPLGLWIAC